ncbi:MAG: phosphonate ABC transporter, permease protein PhnE [Erysipelotrichaceae bacterium]|nr:phosphonate ABC transporter, permease protein PhnE [Erysipelotrichaceae bacterium]
MNKVSLFDKLFKPELITLDNGHTVYRKRSRMPLILLITFIVIFASIQLTGFNLILIIERAPKQLGAILGKIFQPNMDFLPNVFGPLIDTIKMSLLGTIIGCILALPISIISSSNINKNRISLSVVRFLLGLVRTLPTIIIATMAALIFGLGTFAGTVAITIFTFGVVGKMLFESIETIDMGPFEAMESLGANKFEAFWSALMPQILPTYLSHCLYCFEMNIRAASILGYVGAGGLGLLINERIGWRDYNSLGTVLLTLFVAVVIVDFLSTYFRKKLG